MKIQTHNFRVWAACWPLALFTMMSFVAATAEAQGIFPMYGIGAGAISQVAIAQVDQEEFVTAVINGSGNLEIISWLVDENDQQILRLGTWYGPPASAVAISSPFSVNGSTDLFTTAAINANGNLDITTWLVGGSGEIGMYSEVQAGKASVVSVAFVNNASNGSPQFMTAIRNFAGNLQVSLWYLDPSFNIRLSGSGLAGAVNAVSITPLNDQNSDVVTAVANSAGNLELIQWYYDKFGKAVTRGNTAYTSESAYSVAAAPGGKPASNAFYTAVNGSNGQVTLSAWNQALGLQSSTPGGSSYLPVALTSTDTAALMVSGGGDYYLSAFDQTGHGFGEAATAWGQYASNYSIAMVNTYSPDNPEFAVAYRNSAGNLQIEFWQYVPPCTPNCQ